MNGREPLPQTLWKFEKTTIMTSGSTHHPFAREFGWIATSQGRLPDGDPD